jgi:integrase
MQNQPEIIVSDVHRTLAAEVISKQVVTGTKRNYANAISLLEKWLQDHYPTSLADNPFADGSRILLPISVEVITAYMASIQRRDEQGRYVTTGGKLIAVSTMNTVKSAVNNLYRVRKVPVDEALRVELKNFMAGHRRMVASAKENGELNIFEGKRPLTFDGYYNLAEYALKKQNFRAGSLYAHLFVVLSWNLFARSHSVASLMLNHFEWQDDALLVTLPRHKGDQEGTRMFPVHVYANPDKPVVCPILALAIHIFSTQTHVDNDSSNWKLFSGSSVEGKFSNWLQNLLQTNQFNETSLGASKTELGTHSFRYSTSNIWFFMCSEIMCMFIEKVE